MDDTSKALKNLMLNPDLILKPDNKGVDSINIRYTISGEGVFSTITTAVIDGESFVMNSNDDESTLNYHENRLKYNLRLNLTREAIYHLERVIQMRLEMIKDKHCGIHN